VEAYELIRAREGPGLSFREFLAELRATYRAVTDGKRGQVLRDLGSARAAVSFKAPSFTSNRIVQVVLVRSISTSSRGAN